MLAVDQASGSPAAALSSCCSIFQKNKSHRNAGLLFAFAVRTIAWLRAQGLNPAPRRVDTVSTKSSGYIYLRLYFRLAYTNFAIYYVDPQRVAIYIVENYKNF